MRPASKSPDKTFYIFFFNLCISEWTTNKHNTKCNSFILKSSLDTPLRIQITSFYNHEDNNKFLISTNANDAILQRFLINNFVVVYPSAYVLQELYNEEFDCKLEVCVVHASHAGTCASPELSYPSDVDSERTETLSEICRTGG